MVMDSGLVAGAAVASDPTAVSTAGVDPAPAAPASMQ